MEHGPSWEAGSQLVKKFPTFYGTRRFITAFATARHQFLSWASCVQYTPPTFHFLKIHLNIVFPYMSGSPKWSLSLRFNHQNPVQAFPLPDTPYMPRPSHFLDFITQKVLGEYGSLNSLLCNFLHSPVTWVLLSPNIPLSTLFSNTLNLRSSLNVIDQVSHSYKTTGKIMVLYILTLWPQNYFFKF